MDVARDTQAVICGPGTSVAYKFMTGSRAALIPALIISPKPVIIRILFHTILAWSLSCPPSLPPVLPSLYLPQDRRVTGRSREGHGQEGEDCRMHPSEGQRVRTGKEDVLPVPLWLYQAPAHKPRRTSNTSRLLTSPSEVLTLSSFTVFYLPFISQHSSPTLPILLPPPPALPPLVPHRYR